MQESGTESDGGMVCKKPNVGLACVLGVCAALATWAALQVRYPIFTVSDEYSIGMGASNEARNALASEQTRVLRLNSAILLGLGGGLLAALMSIYAPACCSLPVRFVASCLAGVLWGSIIGYFGPTLYSFFMPRDALPSPTNVSLAQAIVFGLLGAGIGLIFALQSRNRSKTPVTVGSGALAGAAGAFVFPIVVSLVLPSASAIDFISEGAVVRLLWLGLPMSAIAAGVPMGATSAPSNESSGAMQLEAKEGEKAE